MNPLRRAPIGILLASASLSAAAIDRPPDQIVGAGNSTCAQFRKTLEEYRGVLRREQPDVVKILQSSIQYANFEGTLGGYLARAQMERGIRISSIESTDEAMEGVYRTCATTPDARYIEAVAQYVEANALRKPPVALAPAPVPSPAVAAAPATAAAPTTPGTPPAPAAAMRVPAKTGQSSTPPGSPIPIQLDASAAKTWEVVQCDAGYSAMNCVVRNISSTDAKGRTFSSKAVTAEGVTVDTRSPIFYDTLAPGRTMRVEFGLGAANYKAVMMEIFAK
jgi:hypothetical protein